MAPLYIIWFLFLEPASIFNGPLNSGSSYRFTQRGLDEKRKVIEYQEWSDEVVPIKIEKIEPGDSNVGAVVGAIVAVVIVLVIVSAVLFYLRRRQGEDGKLVDGKNVTFFL